MIYILKILNITEKRHIINGLLITFILYFFIQRNIITVKNTVFWDVEAICKRKMYQQNVNMGNVKYDTILTITAKEKYNDTVLTLRQT
jgi:hypothetical protein